MTNDQKDAMKALFIYLGGEILAIGGTVGLSLLLNSYEGLGGVTLIRIAGIVLLLVLFVSIFCIPVWIAEEKLDWERRTAIILMVLFGLLCWIIPITLLVEASNKSEVK